VLIISGRRSIHGRLCLATLCELADESHALQCKSVGLHLLNLRLTGGQYAVGGAVCSNEITPRIFKSINGYFPSVIDYEVPAFIADKTYIHPENDTAALDVPTDETVYAMWIGTNDLGNDAFLTDSQVKGKTLVDYVDCVFESLEKLHSAGAKYFVLLNNIPLNYVPQYALPQNGGVRESEYFQNKPKNITQVSHRVMEQVMLVNDAFKYRTPYELKIANRYPGARFALFDVWSLVRSFSLVVVLGTLLICYSSMICIITQKGI